MAARLWKRDKKKNRSKIMTELAFIKDFNNFEAMLLKAIFNKIPFIIDMDKKK